MKIKIIAQTAKQCVFLLFVVRLHINYDQTILGRNMRKVPISFEGSLVLTKVMFTPSDSYSCWHEKISVIVWTAKAQKWPWNKSFSSHTSNIIVLEHLAEEKVWWDECQSTLLNIYFRLSWFQSSCLLIHFRQGPNTCLHYTNVWQLKAYPTCNAPLSRSARHSLAPLQKSRRNHYSYV